MVHRFAESARASSALVSDAGVLLLDAPLRVRLRRASLASAHDDSTMHRTAPTKRST
jgi:hypothetical protein